MRAGRDRCWAWAATLAGSSGLPAFAPGTPTGRPALLEPAMSREAALATAAFERPSPLAPLPSDERGELGEVSGKRAAEERPKGKLVEAAAAAVSGGLD